MLTTEREEGDKQTGANEEEEELISRWQPKWEVLRAWPALGHRKLPSREGATALVLRRSAMHGHEAIVGVLLWGGALRSGGSSVPAPRNDVFFLAVLEKWLRESPQ